MKQNFLPLDQKRRTKTKRIIDKKYKGTAKSNINLYSIICIMKKIIKQIKIHISCLNDSFFNETMVIPLNIEMNKLK